MMAVATLSSMLGLSLLSDLVTGYIRRHAVHASWDTLEERLLSGWVRWGTYETGSMLFQRGPPLVLDSGEVLETRVDVPERLRWFMVRLPGVQYCGPIDFGYRFAWWKRVWLRWTERSTLGPDEWRDGWREIDEPLDPVRLHGRASL